jgi:hypothetical protein
MSKGVLPSVLIRLQNLLREGSKDSRVTEDDHVIVITLSAVLIILISLVLGYLSIIH